MFSVCFVFSFSVSLVVVVLDFFVLTFTCKFSFVAESVLLLAI